MAYRADSAPLENAAQRFTGNAQELRKLADVVAFAVLGLNPLPLGLGVEVRGKPVNVFHFVLLSARPQRLHG